MQRYIRGSPSFEGLAKWQKEALIHPVLDAVKDFYKLESNRMAFEEWLMVKQAFFALEIEAELYGTAS